MATPVKFTFDRAFDGGARSRMDQEIEKVRLDGQTAADQAYKDGLEAGRAEALQGIEKATEQTLGVMAAALQSLFNECEARDQMQAKMTAKVAHIVGTKLAGNLMDKAPLTTVETLIEDCLELVREEPRVVVRVAEALVEPLQERVDALAAAHDFKGNIILIPEQSKGLSDVQVEWPNGGTKRDMMSIEQDIQRIVSGFTDSDGTA